MSSRTPKPVTVCAVGLLAAFFMPWVSVFGTGMSGYNLGQLGSYGNYAWAIPILAGLTILISALGINNRGIGAITGIVPLAIILYTMLKLDLEVGSNAAEKVRIVALNFLSIGAWLTIVLSTAIIIAALVNRPPVGAAADTRQRESNYMSPAPESSSFYRLEALERLVRLKEQGAIDGREFMAEKDRILNFAEKNGIQAEDNS